MAFVVCGNVHKNPFQGYEWVDCFQWIMDTLIKEGLEGTFGVKQNDVNLKKFLEDAESKNLTYNESK